MKRRQFLQTLGAVMAACLVPSVPAAPAITPAMVDALTAPNPALFAVGDVITFKGRYAFNPITRQPTDRLQTFVVTVVKPSVILHPSR